MANNLTFGIELDESNDQIASRLLKSLQSIIDGKMNSLKRPLEARFQELIRNAIRTSPEYASIRDGELRGQLGIEFAFVKIETILTAWVNSVKANILTTRIRNGYLEGGLTIQAIRSGYEDVLSNGAASFPTEGGFVFNWLEWLLLKGDTVILNYQYRTTPPKAIKKYSRTQQGLMFKNNSRRWSVPPEFAGSIDDNMVTRALARMEPQFALVLQQELSKAFK